MASIQLLPLLVFLLAAGILHAQQTTISGRVLGSDGAPMLKAHAYLFRPPSLTPLVFTEAAADGSFVLRSDQAGFLRLKFTGGNHREHSFPIILERPREIRLDIRLGEFPPIQEYDNTGNLVLPSGNSSGRDTMAAVTYHDPDMERLAGIISHMKERQEEMMTEIAARQRTGDTLSPFIYDWSKELSSLTKQIREERAPFLRQALLISYIDLYQQGATGLDPKIVQRAFADIPSTSPLWRLSPGLIGVALRGDGFSRTYEDYLWKVVSTHPDTSFRVQVLYDALGSIPQDKYPEIYRRCYKELIGKYPATREAQSSLVMYNPERNIRIGRDIPPFSVPSIDNPATMITSESMKGKVYLIDFWATWCGPCISVMKELHDVYEKYGGKFEIISFSFDSKPDQVGKFRGDKWKMPWLHGFVEGNFESDLAKRFEVISIPQLILVDEHGRIIATGKELYEEGLEKTFSRMFGEAARQ